MAKNCVAIIVTGLLLQPLTAMAYDPSWPKAADMHFLPPYCKARLIDGPQSPEYEQWARTLGKGFEHIHHYCAGLNFLKRANIEFNKSEEKQLLQQVYNQFSYVIVHAPPTFILIPEILVQRGKVLARLNQHGEALADFDKAIELNPDYANVYMALGDFYKELGNAVEARKALEAGLQHVPDSKGLSRRLKELDSMATPNNGSPAAGVIP